MQIDLAYYGKTSKADVKCCFTGHNAKKISIMASAHSQLLCGPTPWQLTLKGVFPQKERRL